jgi:hypothetical protein
VQNALMPFAQDRAKSMTEARQEILRRNAEGKSIRRLKRDQIEEYSKPVDPMSFTGEKLHGMTAVSLGAMRPGEKAQEATAALQAAGIPGIRYLDANSRGPTGNPTHNHVVFDPSNITIKRRYARGGNVTQGKSAGGYKDVPFQRIEKKSPGWGQQWTPLEDVSNKLGDLTKISGSAANFGDFMNAMAHKASTQGLAPRDLIKAYLMTVSSQGRQAVNPKTVTKNWPDYPGPTHEKIRPEGAMGEWLKSPMGQRYLNAAEQGKIDPAAVQHAMQSFNGFGFVPSHEGTALPWAAQSLVPHTKMVSDMIAASLKGRHSADDWRHWVKKNVKNVGFAKAGFFASMLGRGDQPVPDARQLTLNTPNTSKEAMRNIGVGTSKPANLREGEALQRIADRQRALSLETPKELAPHYQSLAHHTIWDASAGTDTTHQDVINAMQHAATGGMIHGEDEHPVVTIMKHLGMPGLQGDVVHPYSMYSIGRNTARKMFEEQKQIQPINQRMLDSVLLGLQRQKDYGFSSGDDIEHALKLARQQTPVPVAAKKKSGT